MTFPHYFTDDANISWREIITDEMLAHRDSWDAMIAIALPDEPNVEPDTRSENRWGPAPKPVSGLPDLDAKFNIGFGNVEGCAYTVWTQTRVYFPLVYDGAEGCGSVARNPDGIPTRHLGH